VSLNGIWKISWCGDPKLRPLDFWKTDYSDADWCIKLYPNCGFRKGKHELFPFPFSETSVNENIVQNPGW
jgi:hypothetical protein